MEQVTINVNIKVDVPALEKYVGYLIETRQSAIDAITSQVQASTGQLVGSSGKLEDAVNKEKK